MRTTYKNMTLHSNLLDTFKISEGPQDKYDTLSAPSVQNKNTILLQYISHGKQCSRGLPQ